MPLENADSQNQVAQTTHESPEQSSKKKKGLVALIILLVILVILVGGTAWVYFSKNAQVPSTPENTAENTNQAQEGEDQANQAPDSVVSKVDALIIAKVGQDFFQKYITFISGYVMCLEVKGRPCEGPSASDPYAMRYELSIPEKSASETLFFFVDDTGALTQNQTIELPDCVKDAQKCVITVDRQQAVDMATQRGIEKNSDADYEATFAWSEVDGVFAWNVRGVLTNTAHPCGKDETITIGANTGKVLHQTTVEAACTNSTSVTTP